MAGSVDCTSEAASEPRLSATAAQPGSQSRWQRRRRRQDQPEDETREASEQLASQLAEASLEESRQVLGAETVSAAADNSKATDNEGPRAQLQPTSKTSAQNDTKKEPCIICLEDFDKTPDGMPRTCKRCGSCFHQACLAEWNRSQLELKWKEKPWLSPSQIESGSCPTCRSSKGHDKERRWKKE
eukprot:TRINITY_DN35059_c0_g1_i1.p2 TRINITY_DN35059_c0_g1~~TRINITY_DN35059_c0_g1_i1.p2  ORF type:complete len:185 (-),score=27.60 TRINITY_DN35059_c0_g1_i1:49-603(-)